MCNFSWVTRARCSAIINCNLMSLIYLRDFHSLIALRAYLEQSYTHYVTRCTLTQCERLKFEAQTEWVLLRSF